LLPKGNSRELTDVVSTEVVSTEVVSTEVVFTTRFATNTRCAFRALRLPTVHLNLHSLDGQIAWGARSLIFVRLNGVTEISGTTTRGYHEGPIAKKTTKGHSGALAEWPLG
jgi:hypothetical protein